MKPEEKTDNELIAEFMGAKPMRLGNENGVYQTGWIFTGRPSPDYLLQFHTSWDWLMPVVEKIATFTLVYPEQVKRVTGLKVMVLRSVLYERCVAFIKWYNQQPK